jgi:hypothetical protein
MVLSTALTAEWFDRDGCPDKYLLRAINLFSPLWSSPSFCPDVKFMPDARIAWRDVCWVRITALFLASGKRYQPLSGSTEPSQRLALQPRSS